MVSKAWKGSAYGKRLSFALSSENFKRNPGGKKHNQLAADQNSVRLVVKNLQKQSRGIVLSARHP
jgi:hypothetical protein